MNYCENCGKNNSEQALYCSACGAEIQITKAKAEADKKELLKKRIPVTALILSLCGLVCFIALPVQILAFCLALYGLKLNRGKSALSVTAIALSVLGAVFFTGVAVWIAANFETVIGWSVFSAINGTLS